MVTVGVDRGAIVGVADRTGYHVVAVRDACGAERDSGRAAGAGLEVGRSEGVAGALAAGGLVIHRIQ